MDIALLRTDYEQIRSPLQNIEVAHSCDTSMQIFWDEINNYDPDEDDLSRFIVSDSGRGYDGGKCQTDLRRHFAFDQHLL